MTRRCLLMIGNRSMSASTRPPYSGLRQWRETWAKTIPLLPSLQSGCWTVARLRTMFCTASSSPQSWQDKLYWVIMPKEAQSLGQKSLFLDRLKRSSMRTQATQTDVKRKPPLSPAPPTTLSRPTLPIGNTDKAAMSPRALRKVLSSEMENSIRIENLQNNANVIFYALFGIQWMNHLSQTKLDSHSISDVDCVLWVCGAD